jgi:nucleoside-diphosphate-sugar epimerase
MMPLAEPLSDRRVLVTGATGFLGRHLVRALVAARAQTHAVVRAVAPDQPSLVPTSDDRLHLHVCDLTDGPSLAEIVGRIDPEVVFHLAAYGTTPSQRDVELIDRVNIGGTINLWNALDGGPCRFVHAGTSGEYGDASGPLAESRACQPRSRYAAAKHAAITISQGRAAESGSEVAVLRPFGPYGDGDRPERLIPYIIHRLLAGERAELSAGDQVRDFSHVDDHVSAMLLAATATLPSAIVVYNVGSGQPITVRRLAETIAEEVGGDAPLRLAFGARTRRAGESLEMYGDVSAIARDLGFRVRIDLRDGLRRTIAAARALSTIHPVSR